jgi:hypothetical protein
MSAARITCAPIDWRMPARPRRRPPWWAMLIWELRSRIPRWIRAALTRDDLGHPALPNGYYRTARFQIYCEKCSGVIDVR